MTDTDLDIVKRLRMVQGDNEEAREAADTIAQLRAALTYISEHGDRPADQLALEALFALAGKMPPQSNQEPELTKRLRGENWWLNVTGDEAADEIEQLRELLWQEAGNRVEIDRLTLENWQLKGALGYPVPGDIPQGPFKCGLCEARALEPKPFVNDWPRRALEPKP